ncbi:MAG: sigma 54-interacting transcriptional regulator [Deltaproteobacteria bacterium]|nr:sigma 54-interacting transcriptional regulator [Deltaproteobacteria bacterium]
MSSEAHREARVPVFARVEASGPSPLGTMYAWNLSGGGVYLKAPGLTAQDVPLGRSMHLAIALPDGGAAIEATAEVAWVDPAVRDHRGERAVGMGVRFASLPGAGLERIRRFIESFRYRVVGLGLADDDACAQAFGDLFPLHTVSTEQELFAAAQVGQVGLILLGEAQGPIRALELLRRITESREIERQPPLLYLGRQAVPAIEPMIARNARVSFARLPIEPLELRSLVRRAVEGFVADEANKVLTTERRRALDHLRRENEYLRDRVREPERLQELVGESPAMRRVFALVERVAPVSTGVLILGETGTGKDLVARAIHALSSRRDRPLLAQNCAALTEGLLDSELFGHARGAFTGAMGERAGLFEAADGGTVFLDEVGEMPPSMQAKLLRVLESGELRRVGETKARTVDVRVISATHRSLEALAASGHFRKDLYYRLRSFVIELPPLRDRREDVPVLALHFLDRLTERHGMAARGLTAQAMALLEAHDWPGNARELLHTLERLLLLAPQDGRIDADLVRETLSLEQREVPKRTLPKALEDLERSLIEAELARCGGVVARAARALGVDRSTISKRCKRLGIRVAGAGRPSLE